MDKEEIGAKELEDISLMLKRWAKFAKDIDDPQHFIEMIEIHRVGIYLERLIECGYITIDQYKEVVLLCVDLTADLLQLEEK